MSAGVTAGDTYSQGRKKRSQAQTAKPLKARRESRLKKAPALSESEKKRGYFKKRGEPAKGTGKGVEGVVGPVVGRSARGGVRTS